MILKALSIEDYLNKVPKERQSAINKLRKTIVDVSLKDLVKNLTTE
jgi:hypothetical protein